MQHGVFGYGGCYVAGSDQAKCTHSWVVGLRLQGNPVVNSFLPVSVHVALSLGYDRAVFIEFL